MNSEATKVHAIFDNLHCQLPALAILKSQPTADTALRLEFKTPKALMGGKSCRLAEEFGRFPMVGVNIE